MKPNMVILPVEVFSGIIWEAEMVKNILEDSGIEAFLQDEISGTLVPFFSEPGFGSVKVVVSNLDYDKAVLIVEEFGEIFFLRCRNLKVFNLDSIVPCFR